MALVSISMASTELGTGTHTLSIGEKGIMIMSKIYSYNRIKI